jgi:very-short-patch-repair endonuclease
MWVFLALETTVREFGAEPATNWRDQRATRAPEPASVGAMPTRDLPPPADGPISGDMDRVSAHRHPRVDHRIAELATDQHGIVSLSQLRGLGFSESAVHKRIAAGRLHQLHQGVYAVGHAAATPERRFLAAVIACGPRALLSHRSAAALWGLREDRRASIDVTAPNRRGRTPLGIGAHRDRSLTAADRAQLHGIPCTTVERTLLDFAAVAPIWELRKAISEAEVLRILDHDAVRGLVKRNRGRRGVARLRMLLDEIHPLTKRTRSEMEQRFLSMCVRAGLPQPEVNVSLQIDGRCVKPDFLWRDAHLVVEADSRRYHDTDSAFQGDRRREQRLLLAGWRVARCTWEQVEREPRNLAETIRGLLAQAAPRRRA